MIKGYEGLIPQLNLPDTEDRHVLAAAIHACAQVILTYNHRDFPRWVLAPYGLTAQHPDDFLVTVMKRFSTEVDETLEKMRARKTRPPLSQAELPAEVYPSETPEVRGGSPRDWIRPQSITQPPW